MSTTATVFASAYPWDPDSGDTALAFAPATFTAGQPASRLLDYRRFRRARTSSGSINRGAEIRLAAAQSICCWSVLRVAADTADTAYQVGVYTDNSATFLATDYQSSNYVDPRQAADADTPGFGLALDGFAEWADISHVVGVDPTAQDILGISQTGPQSITVQSLVVRGDYAATAGYHEFGPVILGQNPWQLLDFSGAKMGPEKSAGGLASRQDLVFHGEHFWQATAGYRTTQYQAEKLKWWATERMNAGGLAFIFPIPTMPGTAPESDTEDDMRNQASGPAMRGGAVKIQKVHPLARVGDSIASVDIKLDFCQWHEEA